MLRVLIEDAHFFSSKINNKNKQRINFKKFLLCLLSPEFRLVVWFRIYSYLYVSRTRKIGFLLYCIIKKSYSSDIHPMAKIGVPLKLGHHMGIVIGPKVVIGDYCYIFNNVNIGNKCVGGDDYMPEIGNFVLVSAGAKILGGIKVSDKTVIGANSVLLSDTYYGETWCGAPAVRVR